MSFSEPLRGNMLLHAWQLERFPFLKKRAAKKESAEGAPPARYMQSEFNTDEFPQWCPRDCIEPCGTYEEFKARGYDRFHVPLSLVGHGGTPKKPAPVAISSNPFTRAQYSYIHFPFNRIVEFLNRLHRDDRFLAFLLYEGAFKTHIYADVDADLDKFPAMRNNEEVHIAEFVNCMHTFFKKTFGRVMDLRGLMLLQASNQKKMSWHVHVQSEAFTEVKQLKAFVQGFREYLEESDARMSYHLCTKVNDDFVHIVDIAPYGSNQNFRCPGNQKPGKNPLIVRTFEWIGDARLHFTPQKDASVVTISEEVLFRAHPNLALPTRQGYTFLEMPLDADQTQLVVTKKSRKHARDAPVDAEAEENKRLKKADRVASQTQLTDDEESLVRNALVLHLGNRLEFAEVFRAHELSTGNPCIQGSAVKQTASCPFRSTVPGESYVHKGNRMRFQLTRESIAFFCFDPDCKPVNVAWPKKMKGAILELFGEAPPEEPVAKVVEAAAASPTSSTDSTLKKVFNMDRW